MYQSCPCCGGFFYFIFIYGKNSHNAQWTFIQIHCALWEYSKVQDKLRLFINNIHIWFFMLFSNFFSKNKSKITFLLIYMALQSRFDQGQAPCYRCSRHPPTWILLFLGFVCLVTRSYKGFSVIGLRYLLSCAQRSAMQTSCLYFESTRKAVPNLFLLDRLLV
jgi:hypothetical protein